MKLTMWLAMLALLCLGVGCGSGKTNSYIPPAASSPTPVPTTSTPMDGNYSAKGKVTKINLELGSVELDHDDIPGVMPPMLMEFYVKDKALLDGLKVGDEVDFVLEYKHPAETIVRIKKIP